MYAKKLLLRVNRLPQSGLKAGRHKYIKINNVLKISDLSKTAIL